MKKIYKHLFAFILAVILTLGFSSAVLADDDNPICPRPEPGISATSICIASETLLP